MPGIVQFRWPRCQADENLRHGKPALSIQNIKAQWKWRTQWSTKAIAVPDNFDGEWIDKKLDTMFASLQKFEKELTSKLETQHRLSK